MLPRGLHFLVRSSQKPLILLMLFGIALAIYTYLRKKIIFERTYESVNTQILIESLLQKHGLNQVLSRYAVSQSAHETANFTSNIFKSNNNAFGMKYAKQITAQGEKNGYAYYISLENSVIDFVAWYSRHRNSIISLPLIILSLTDYVKFFKNNKYFEAAESEYLNGCQYFYNLYYGGTK